MRLVAVLSALLLTGCTVQSAPAPLQGDELEHYVTLMQDRVWFYSPHSTETRPQVEWQLVHTDEMEDAYSTCALADEVSDTACQMTLLYYPNEIGYFSASELTYVYDYYALELVPCLATQGLNVVYMPSRAQFASKAGWISWDPYSELGAELPPSRADAILEACPADPPNWGAWR